MPKPRMIFHAPFALDPGATAASGIRPMRMRQAFEAIGYEVVEVTGWARERRRRMREVRRTIRGGERFEFVYSEASTKPMAMTQRHSLPTHPLLDLSFLSFCKDRGIPTGMFYRDIYWNEPAYLDSVSRAVAIATRSLYRWDLIRFQRSLTRIFVPSLTMARAMPHTRLDQCVALPPGSDAMPEEKARDVASMFYVGALGAYYRLHEAVRAVAATPGSSLTLCTSEALWRAERKQYETIMDGSRTRVVHASGEALEPHYADAALGCLFMEPIPYREFAAPMKLYEYLGHGKPVVATRGSLAGAFVEEHGIGWAIPYEAAELSRLLSRLQQQPHEYEEMRERVLRVREQHTWEARARQAAQALDG